MKTLVIMAMAAFFAMAPQARVYPDPEDFTIDSDRTVNGVRTIVVTPVMVCSRRIEVKVGATDNIIQSVVYTGGCNGNLKAVGALLKGMTVQQAYTKLRNIDCGGRGTSCSDQLARALKRCYPSLK